MIESAKHVQPSSLETQEEIREGLENWQLEKDVERAELIANYRERVAVPSQTGFHTTASLSELIQDARSVWNAWGYTNLMLDNSSEFNSFDGTLYAVSFNASSDKGEKMRGWITLESQPGMNEVRYRNSLNGEIVDCVATPPGFEMKWLEDTSRRVKVVKSRPMWMYSRLLDVPHDELWPKGGKVAVIGDPEQACDKEGVTIIEYEYSEEIVPPILESIVKGSQLDIRSWLQSLYREDIRALEDLKVNKEDEFEVADSRGNPYSLLVQDLIELSQWIGEKVRSGKSADVDREDFDRLKLIADKLMKGTWEPDDVNIVSADRAEVQEYMRPWYATVQFLVGIYGFSGGGEKYLTGLIPKLVNTDGHEGCFLMLNSSEAWPFRGLNLPLQSVKGLVLRRITYALSQIRAVSSEAKPLILLTLALRWELYSSIKFVLFGQLEMERHANNSSMRW